MENAVLLSYVVPVYNVEAYLEKCVAGLLCPSDAKAYEIILVDDGSTDGCPSVCDRLARECSEVRTIHQENGGLSDARNTGVKAAKGRYICFVDSDDYLEEGAPEQLLRTAARSDADILCYGAIHETANGRQKRRFYPCAEELSGAAFIAEQYAHHQMQIAVWNSVYRRDFLLKNNLWFQKGLLHEDLQWTPRVFLAAEKVRCVNEPFYVYQIRDGSISQQKDMSKNMLDIKRIVLEFDEALKPAVEPALYRMIKDRLICNYLSMFAEGNFGGKGKQFALDGKMVSSDLANTKTKGKALLYRFSKKGYCFISNFGHKGG